MKKPKTPEPLKASDAPKRSLQDQLRTKRQHIILDAQGKARLIELALANLDAATHDAENVLGAA